MYIKYYQKKKKALKKKLILDGGPDTDVSTDTIGIMAEKSHEFSYKELANATNNFSGANKIGHGGFGEVYYAELRGEVCNLLNSFNFMYVNLLYSHS